METQDRGKTIAIGILIAVISLPLGYVVLQILQTLIELLWVDLPKTAPDPVIWAITLIIPTLAGIGVAVLRRRGADGHNPLGGIAINPITAKDYPTVIGAIAITLVGGLVLGPEVAMVSTGAFVGTVIGNKTRMKLSVAVTTGAGFAILALFVNPIVNGSFSNPGTYEFDARDLVGAVGVAALTALVLGAGRLLSIGILKLHGGDTPRISVLAISGFIVGATALGYYLATGNEIALVLTSGESETQALIALGSTGAIAITIAAKWLTYSISMGAGFRGGPFFPAIYIAAGIGAIATIQTPDYAQGALAAGLTAAFVYLAHGKWPAMLILGVVLGLIVGGPQIVPLAIVAAIVAKLLPSVKDLTKPTGEQTITLVR
ncbi:MAG: hypothetical protein HQ526_02625 [Actinobacteria bacterium]|nr:hypothetical protein [Actinomycetota bacterium]